MCFVVECIALRKSADDNETLVRGDEIMFLFGETKKDK